MKNALIRQFNLLLVIYILLTTVSCSKSNWQTVQKYEASAIDSVASVALIQTQPSGFTSSENLQLNDVYYANSSPVVAPEKQIKKPKSDSKINSNHTTPNQTAHSVTEPIADDTTPNNEGANNALILGIISVVLFPLGFIFGPIAIVAAVRAQRKINADPDSYTGAKQAKTGLILGIISSALGLILLTFIITLFLVYFAWMIFPVIAM